jgi:hypothetical protein
MFKVDQRMVDDIVALSGQLQQLLIKGTARARDERERVGMMGAALVGAAQLIDGAEFARPGVTSVTLDVLARGHQRFMARLAEELRGKPSLDQARAWGRAGDSGDNGDKVGTVETLSPSVPTENAQELPVTDRPSEQAIEQVVPAMSPAEIEAWANSITTSPTHSVPDSVLVEASGGMMAEISHRFENVKGPFGGASHLCRCGRHRDHPIHIVTPVDLRPPAAEPAAPDQKHTFIAQGGSQCAKCGETIMHPVHV